jgi:hypothetical protein
MGSVGTGARSRYRLTEVGHFRPPLTTLWRQGFSQKTVTAVRVRSAPFSLQMAISQKKTIGGHAAISRIAVPSSSAVSCMLLSFAMYRISSSDARNHSPRIRSDANRSWI